MAKTTGSETPTRNWRLPRILIFPVICLVLLGSIGLDNRRLWPRIHESVLFTYLDSLQKGQFGTGYGYPAPDHISFAGLEPGDIVLGGWPNCAYGRFSHVGLYVGNDQVMEGYVDLGLTLQDVDHYRNYSDICLLKVKADSQLKHRVAAYAMARQGQMFYPAAFKPGERYWNCSKIIWSAYLQEGIDLDELGDLWIAPEKFMDSRHVEILYEKRN